MTVDTSLTYTKVCGGKLRILYNKAVTRTGSAKQHQRQHQQHVVELQILPQKEPSYRPFVAYSLFSCETGSTNHQNNKLVLQSQFEDTV